LHNWVEPLDLVCKSRLSIGMIGSIFFKGFVLSTLIVPPLADRFGRKWFLVGSVFVGGVLSIVGLIFSHSLAFTYSMMFVAGFCTSGRFLVNFVYAAEFMTERWRIILGIVMHVFDSISSIFAV
jgi:MFS family permease